MKKLLMVVILVLLVAGLSFAGPDIKLVESTPFKVLLKKYDGVVSFRPSGTSYDEGPEGWYVFMDKEIWRTYHELDAYRLTWDVRKECWVEGDYKILYVIHDPNKGDKYAATRHREDWGKPIRCRHLSGKNYKSTFFDAGYITVVYRYWGEIEGYRLWTALPKDIDY
jgi:hypothetical protein